LATIERANAGLHPHITERLQTLVPQRDARIVDVGSGSGSMLGRLAAAGYSDLHGIDIVRPREADPGIGFTACDLDELHTAFESASVDMIVSVEVFEHIENLGSLRRSWHACCTPKDTC
jgi:2-polyprenyl-3-methyl-5-hydroxy-6-metoxy-1,4-benzoquinol methylase